MYFLFDVQDDDCNFVSIDEKIILRMCLAGADMFVPSRGRH